MGKNKEMLTDLETFHKELKSYYKLLYSNKGISDAQKRYRESLRERLVEKSGALSQRIYKLTGKLYINLPLLRTNTTIWSEGLGVNLSTYSESALNLCIDATKETIGKIKAMGKFSKYELTSPIYWIERFGRWIPIDTAIRWVKRHRLASVIVTVIMLIAAFITIVGFVKGFFNQG